MATLGDLTNPKNSWLITYERSVIHQFLGLLVEMNASAKSMTLRYELLTYGEAGGPQRDFSFDKETEMQKHSLSGVGAALIIGADLLIKDVQISSGAVQRNGEGPKFRKAKWEQVIRAGGNYVRHGDEWRTLYRDFCVKKNVSEFSFEDRPELIEDFLEALETQRHKAFGSLKVLREAGIQLDNFLFAGNRIWDMADTIRLTDVEISMNQMRQFLDSFYDRPSKRK